jgi:hypothetical protein
MRLSSRLKRLERIQRETERTSERGYYCRQEQFREACAAWVEKFIHWSVTGVGEAPGPVPTDPIHLDSFARNNSDGIKLPSVAIWPDCAR